MQIWTEVLGPQHEKDRGWRLAIQIQQWVKSAHLKAPRGCLGTNFHGSCMLRLNRYYASKKSFVLFTPSSFLCVGINGKQMLESACKIKMFETVVALTTTVSNHADTLLIAVAP